MAQLTSFSSIFSIFILRYLVNCSLLEYSLYQNFSETQKKPCSPHSINIMQKYLSLCSNSQCKEAPYKRDRCKERNIIKEPNSSQMNRAYEILISRKSVAQ